MNAVKAIIGSKGEYKCAEIYREGRWSLQTEWQEGEQRARKSETPLTKFSSRKEPGTTPCQQSFIKAVSSCRRFISTALLRNGVILISHCWWSKREDDKVPPLNPQQTAGEKKSLIFRANCVQPVVQSGPTTVQQVRLCFLSF